MGSGTANLAIFQELADDLAGMHVPIQDRGGHWIVPKGTVTERVRGAVREAAVALLVPPDVVAIEDGAHVLDDYCLESCPAEPETCCNPDHVGLRIKGTASSSP